MMIELLTHLNNIESSMKRFKKRLIKRKNKFQKLCNKFVDTEDYFEKNIDVGIILTEELIEIYLLILENFPILTDPFNTIITLNDLKHLMNITNKHTKKYIMLILPLENNEPVPLENNVPVSLENNLYGALLQDGLTILMELKEKLDKKYTFYLSKVEPNNIQNYYLNDITDNKYHNLIYVEEKIID